MKKHIIIPADRFSWPGKIRCLSLSGCSAFFPADVYVKGEMVHACFRTEGYIPLKDIRMLTSGQCLGILKELIQHLHAARDWMWYPETLVLTLDTVWIGRDDHLRLLCIPDSCELPQYRRISLFAESLKRITDEEGRADICRLQKDWLDGPQPDYRVIGGIDRMILDRQEYSSYRFIK